MRYYNFRLVCEDTVIENAFIEIENKFIKDFGISKNTNGIDLNNCIVMPGFIDGHIHGVLGKDFMDACNNSYETILNYLPSEGVTSVLATTMTHTIDTLRNVVEFIDKFKSGYKQTKIAGIHLEGPFISEKKVGAQNPSNILSLQTENFEKIRNGSKKIKVVTYAVENDCDFQFTKHLVNHGIKGSIGHSNANLRCCTKAFNVGTKRLTHMYNAMSGHEHRNPGVVTSAFLNKMLCELIVDKIHVDSDVINATYKIVGSNNIVLITDSMKAKGLGDGDYEFGGQKVNVVNGTAKLKNNTLAGSTLKYDDGVKNFYKITDCNLTDIVKVTSVNQSKDLKLNTGQIKKGFYADLVVLDDSLSVKKTIINGEVVYER